MARTAPTISCGPEDRRELEGLAASRTESKQMVERARIILSCLGGKRVKQIARQCHTRPNTVIKWRQRFVSQGLRGLRDAPRPGAKRRYDEAFRNRVLALFLVVNVNVLRANDVGSPPELPSGRAVM